VVRLIPLLLVLIGLLILAFALHPLLRRRNDRVYRPRGPRPTARERSAGRGTNWIVSRTELEGVRDAYSSAPIDPDAPLWRCGGCLACYHQRSVEALQSRNAGRCALCASDDLRPVRVV